MNNNKPIILAYHSINDQRRDPLAVSSKEFEKQLSFLKERGYQSLTLNQLGHLLTTSGSLPEKCFVITLDDGYRDNYFVAWPILNRFNFNATVFVVAGLIDSDKMLKPEKYIEKYGGNFEDYEILRWNEIAELHRHGIEIGSHSFTHKDLTTLDDKELQKEVSYSKELIEDNISAEISSFCYPSGRLNLKVIEATKNADYKQASRTYCTNHPVSDLLFCLPRVGIYSHTNFGQFRIKIASMTRIFRGFITDHCSKFPENNLLSHDA